MPVRMSRSGIRVGDGDTQVNIGSGGISVTQNTESGRVTVKDGPSGIGVSGSGRGDDISVSGNSQSRATVRGFGSSVTVPVGEVLGKLKFW